MARSRTDKSMTGGGHCPICRASTFHRFRPFCSRRCADVDLSRWLRGTYAIPVLADDDEDGDDAGAAMAGRGGANGRDDDGAGEA